MKASKRTKDVKKLSFVFWLISTLMLIGVVVFVLVSAFSKIGSSDKTGIDILSESAKNQIISLSITTIICVLLIFIIKDKVRQTIYMLSMIMATILYKELGMYIVAGVWALDEYVIHALYKHYRALITINKEIDRRG